MDIEQFLIHPPSHVWPTYELAPDASYILYVADQETVHSNELFGTWWGDPAVFASE